MSDRKQFIDGISPSTSRKHLDDFSGRSRIEGGFNRPLRNKLSTDGVVKNEPTANTDLNSIGVISDNKKTEDTILSSMDISTTPDQSLKEQKTGFFKSRKAKKAAKKALKKPKSRTRVFIKRFGLGVSLVVVAYFGLVFLKAWTSFNNIIDRAGAGSPLLGASISASELNGEGDGRVNIALLGIGGEHHTAGDLADTILVASIDPIAHEAGILSVPRDLYVTIPGYGQSKINAAQAYGELYGFSEPGYPDDGPGLMQKTLEETLGIPIHYYIRVDFDGFKEVVDAVDGIDITLDRRVYDPVFDREYGSHALDIGPGLVHLDGLTALLLGRARGSTGGVGLASSDFDRGDHQRLMLEALKDKILSASTYTDPTNLLSLLDALGGHLRTNLQPGDLLRLKEIAQDIPPNDIISYGLDTGADSYLSSSTTAGGAAILVPRDGTFAAIKNFVRGIFVDGFIKSEDAKVDVLNGTKTAGLATEQADTLKSYGYNVGVIGNAPTQDYEVTKLYALSNLDPYTQRYLEQRFKVTASSTESLPEGISTTADFVIILGSDSASQDET